VPNGMAARGTGMQIFQPWYSGDSRSCNHRHAGRGGKIGIRSGLNIPLVSARWKPAMVNCSNSW